MASDVKSKVLATAKCETKWCKYTLKLIVFQDYRHRWYRIVKRYKWSADGSMHQEVMCRPLSEEAGMRYLAEIVERVEKTGQPPWC